MKNMVAAIDFGTSKIVTLVAENSGAQRCDIVGAGIAGYDGFLPEGWNNPEEVNEKIRISVEDLVKPLVEGDVLTIEVQHQNRTVSEGIEPLGQVDQVVKHRRDQSGDEEISVFTEVFSKNRFPFGLHFEEAALPGDRRGGCGRIHV